MQYLNIVQIVISVGLITALLFQTRGGGLGGIFGQPDTVYRTRRGVEKRLFQLTIALVIIFLGLALAVVKLAQVQG